MKGFANKPKVIGRQNQVDKSKIDASINEQKAYEFLVRNQEAKEWIEDMIGSKLPPGTANFADHLRDGTKNTTQYNACENLVLLTNQLTLSHTNICLLKKNIMSTNQPPVTRTHKNYNTLSPYLYTPKSQ